MSKTLREALIAKGVIVPAQAKEAAAPSRPGQAKRRRAADPADPQLKEKSKKSTVKSQGKRGPYDSPDKRPRSPQAQWNSFHFFPLPEPNRSIYVQLYWLANANKYLMRRDDPDVRAGWHKVARRTSYCFARCAQDAPSEYRLACQEMRELLEDRMAFHRRDAAQKMHEMIKLHKQEDERLTKATRLGRKKAKIKHRRIDDDRRPTDYSLPIMRVSSKTGIARWRGR